MVRIGSLNHQMLPDKEVSLMRRKMKGSKLCVQLAMSADEWGRSDLTLDTVLWMERSVVGKDSRKDIMRLTWP